MNTGAITQKYVAELEKTLTAAAAETRVETYRQCIEAMERANCECGPIRQLLEACLDDAAAEKRAGAGGKR